MANTLVKYYSVDGAVPFVMGQSLACDRHAKRHDYRLYMCNTAHAMERSPADRVRERIERWIEMAGLTQAEFAGSLRKTQEWLQKVLNGENHVRLRDLDLVADAMRSTASELVRHDDDRYQLELTPTEVRIVEQLRRHPETFTGVALLLRIPVPVHVPGEAISDEARPSTDTRRRR